MKKLITLFALITLIIPSSVLAQSTVTQGGTGLTSVPAGSLLVGNSPLRLTSTTSPTLTGLKIGSLNGLLNAVNGVISTIATTSLGIGDFWNRDTGNGYLYPKTLTDKIGISTTTPYGLLSVNPNSIAGPSFVIGSSTATNFIVSNTGNVGIGVLNPTNALLELAGSATGARSLYVTRNAFSGSSPVVEIRDQTPNTLANNASSVYIYRSSAGAALDPSRFAALIIESDIRAAALYASSSVSQNTAVSFANTIAGSATNANTSALTALQVTGNALYSSGSASYTGLLVNPVINQTGTATGGYTALLVNPTQTSFLGTDGRLLDVQLGGSSKFVVKNTGNVGIGNTTPQGALSLSNTNYYTLTRTIPIVVGDEVDIGTFTLSNGSGAFKLDISVPSGGYSQTKQYVVSGSYNSTGGLWQTVLPLTTTGPYGGNDVDLEINGNNLVTSFRLRRVGGTGVGTANILLTQQGVAADVFTSSTATSSVAAPLSTYLPTALTQNNGNVGVGVLTPNTKLAVAGSAYFTGGVVLGGFAGVTTPIAGGLIASTSITIGTNAPTQSAALTVIKPGTGPVVGAYFGNTDNGAFTSETRILFDQGGAYWQGVAGRYNNGSPVISFSVNSTPNTWAEKMRLTSTGFLGIGTTSPAYRLDVAGDINATGTLRFNGDPGTSGYVLRSNGSSAPSWVATSTLGLGGSGTPSIGGGITGGSNKSILFVNPAGTLAQNSNFVYDTATGQMRVGPTDPLITAQNIFSVTGNVNDFNSIYVGNQSTGTAASADYIVANDVGSFLDAGINGSAYSNAAYTMFSAGESYIYNSASAFSIGTGSASPLKFFTGGTLAANERMRIDATGNVGIGSTTPGSPLSVQAATNANTATFAYGAGSAQLNIVGNAASPQFLSFGVVGGTLSVGQIRYDNSTNAFGFRTNGVATDRLTISSTGNVGIGTTSPVRKLSVSGGDILVSNLGTAADSVLIGDPLAGGYPGIWFGANTISPSYTNYSFLYDSAAGTVFNTPSGLSTAFRVGNAEKVRIDTNGNVGIGTSSPISKLAVQGSIHAYGQILASSSDSATTPGFSWLNDLTTGMFHAANSVIGWAIGGIQKMTLTATGLGIGSTTPSSLLSLNSTSSTTPYIDIASSTTSVFKVSPSTNPYFGLGTSTPAFEFEMFSTGTTTASFDSNSSNKGACMRLKDSDGVGYTYMTVNNGVATFSINACN